MNTSAHTTSHESYRLMLGAAGFFCIGEDARIDTGALCDQLRILRQAGLQQIGEAGVRARPQWLEWHTEKVD